MITTLVSITDFEKPFPVNARDLYEALDVGRDFSSWVKYQIERYGFVENVDYRKSQSPNLVIGDNHHAKSGEMDLFEEMGDRFSPNRGETLCSPNLVSKKEDRFTPNLAITTSSPDLESKMEARGGHNRVDVFLSVNMTKHIATCSNTETGKQIREYLFAVEAAWNSEESIIMRSNQVQQRIIARQKAEIAALADDARVVRIVAVAEGERTLSEIGKINGIGPHRIFPLLAERKIIFRGRDDTWVPYQEHVDAGYFTVKENPFTKPNGQTQLKIQTYVTGKGEVWLAKQLFRPEPAQQRGINL